MTNLPSERVRSEIHLSPSSPHYEERQGGRRQHPAHDSWQTNVLAPRRAANPMSDEHKAAIIAAEIAIFGHRRTFD